MRLARWAPWVQNILETSPGIASVETFAKAGIADKPCGVVATLGSGSKFALQWVRTAATGDDDHSRPEKPVTGEPPPTVPVPQLPTSGPVATSLVEAHLVALITNTRNAEIAAVEAKSAQPDPGPRPCGLNVRMHSGASVFGLFLWTLSSGQKVPRFGGAYEQVPRF